MKYKILYSDSDLKIKNLKGGANYKYNLDIIPVIFTLLDGSLNMKFSTSVQKNLQFLYDHELFIDIIEYDFAEEFDRDYIKEINIMMSQNPQKGYLLPIIDVFESIEFNEFIKGLKANYFISSGSLNHAISFYLTGHKLLLINSGNGISSNHNSISNSAYDPKNDSVNKQNLYNLWKSYNIRNETENVLKKIVIFTYIFTTLHSNELQNNVLKDDPTKVRKIIYNILNDLDFGKEFYKYFTDSLRNEYAINKYYEILKPFEEGSESSFFTKEELTNFINLWNAQANDNSDNFMQSYFQKYIFAEHNSFLYTYSQEDGTCSWFSVYWYIVANLIKDKNPIEGILNMLTEFKRIINEKYSEENYLEFNLIDYSILNLLIKYNFLDNRRDIKFFKNKIFKMNIDPINTTPMNTNIQNKKLISNYEFLNNLNNLSDLQSFELDDTNKIFLQNEILNEFYLDILITNNIYNISERYMTLSPEYINQQVFLNNYDFAPQAVIITKEEAEETKDFENFFIDKEKMFFNGKEVYSDKKNKYKNQIPYKNTIFSKEDKILLFDLRHNFDNYQYKFFEFNCDYTKPLNELSLDKIINNNHKLNTIKFYSYFVNQSTFESYLTSGDINDFNNNIIDPIIKKKDSPNIYELLFDDPDYSNVKSLSVNYYKVYNVAIFIKSLLNDVIKHSEYLGNILFGNPFFFSKDEREEIIFKFLKFNTDDSHSDLNRYIYLLVADNFDFKYKYDGNYEPSFNFNNDVIERINYINFDEYEKHIEKILEINGITNLFHNKVNFKEMKENFLNNFIFNKLEKYGFEIVNGRINYEGEQYQFCIPEDNHHFSVNFLNSTKIPTRCLKQIRNENIFILINELHGVESNYTEELLIIHIKLSNENEIIALKFNDYDVIRYEDKKIENFPFLLFEPIISNSFVLHKSHTFYLLILANHYDGDDLEILSNKTIINPSVLLLEIGNSFIFPKFKSEEEIRMLKYIYSNFGCREEVMYNFNFDGFEEGAFRLKNYNVKEKYINNLNYCRGESIYNRQNTTTFNFLDIELKKFELLTALKGRYTSLSYELELDVPLELRGHIDEQDLQEFKKKNPYCEFNCKDIKELKNLIYETMEQSIEYRSELTKKFSYDNFTTGGIFEIMFNNYDALFNIMQINIFLNNLDRIIKIVEKCNSEFTCKEIAEINSYLIINELKNDENNFINLVFELLFGFNIKNEQMDVFYSILNSYRTDSDRVINQFMMGKGKSSVITPLLLLNLCNSSENLDVVNIVVPGHLIYQTKRETSVLKNIFNMNFNIYSDYEAKLNLIEGNVTPNDLFIFDEFDMMYNPIQSNFNLIIDKGKNFFNKENIILILDIIESYEPDVNINKDENLNVSSSMESKITSSKPDELKDKDVNSLIREVKSILKFKNVININYGMSKKKDLMPDNTFKRWVIPYLRKDTPVENSNFSSILVTLVLTIKYFQENDYKFEEEDLHNIYQKDKDFFINENIGNTTERDFIYKIKELQDSKGFKIDPRNYVIEYIYNFIVTNLKYNDTIKNCSFIDLMNSGKWATGFSGTVNINLPQLEINKFRRKIEDKDEKIGVYYALTGRYPNSKNRYHTYNNESSIFDILRQETYNCLIDIAAIFKDKSNKDVIMEILKIDMYNHFKGIYLDINDNIKITDISGHENNFSKFPENDFIIFFSQRNIVGIDIPNQPNNMKGLAIISKSERYTNVAQAIYRMRKLNKGQTIDIAYEEDSVTDIEEATEENKKINVYNKILENELNYNENNIQFLDLQYLKFMIRKNINQDSFTQKNMKPIFIRKYEKEIYNIQNIFNDQIKINDYILNDNEDIRRIYDRLLGYSYLESILFGGSIQDQEQEQEQDQEQENEKKMDQDISYKDIFGEFELSLKSFIFPREGSKEDILDLLRKTCEQIEDNESYSLYLSLDCLKSYRVPPKIYFIELFDNIFLLIDSDGKSTIDLYSDLHLYIRDFRIYDIFGDCINSEYFSDNDTINLNTKYMKNSIFEKLKKLINTNIDKKEFEEYESVLFKKFLSNYAEIDLFHPRYLKDHEFDDRTRGYLTKLLISWNIDTNENLEKMSYHDIFGLYRANEEHDLFSSDLQNNPFFEYYDKIDEYIRDLQFNLLAKINYNKEIFLDHVNNLTAKIANEITSNSTSSNSTSNSTLYRFEEMNDKHAPLYFGYTSPERTIYDFFLDLISKSNKFPYLIDMYQYKEKNKYEIIKIYY